MPDSVNRVLDAWTHVGIIKEQLLGGVQKRSPTD